VAEANACGKEFIVQTNFGHTCCQEDQKERILGISYEVEISFDG